MKNSLNKSQIERFSRQLILKNIGPKGQKKILLSKVLIIGSGFIKFCIGFFPNNLNDRYYSHRLLIQSFLLLTVTLIHYVML